MSKMYDEYTNIYPVQKTLRFELRPQGNTLKNLEKDGILTEDIHRAESYKKVKKIIDEYHKQFIDKVLTNATLNSIDEYFELFIVKNRNQEEISKLDSIEDKLRKQVADNFSKDPDFDKLFKKDLIKSLLPSFVENDHEKESLIDEFSDFTTYFKGFHENRKNIYSKENISTSIGYRLINQNLPKYCQNLCQFEVVKKTKLFDHYNEINEECQQYLKGDSLETVFCLDHYNSVLTQECIDNYNFIVGVLNKRINLFNQKQEKHNRLAQMQYLYKQILSEKVKSFIPEQFESDDEIINSINSIGTIVINAADSTNSILNELDVFRLDGIYIRNDKSISELSQRAFSNWGEIGLCLEKEYDEINNKKTKSEKPSEAYINKRKSALAAVDSYSVKHLIDVVPNGEKVLAVLKSNDIIFDNINKTKCKYDEMFKDGYCERKKLKNNDPSIAVIKEYLDSLLSLLHLIKPLLGKGNESGRDEVFYSTLIKSYDELVPIIELYNKVRNYVTQKPYSTDKVKINFRNPQLLAGWDANKEKDCLAVILTKDENYYLGIINKNNKKIFDSIPVQINNEEVYKKMSYKLLPGPNKMLPKVFFSKKNEDIYRPSEYILDGYEKGWHKKGEVFRLGFCHDLINYFKECISIHPDWKKFNFDFSDTEKYEDISKFYDEVQTQGYKITFADIQASYIDELVENGSLYLFQIYNKDFSPCSKGTPNLHTMYWRSLFSEDNLNNVVYKLNGEAEVFFRRASISPDEKVVHKANQAIGNKNELNERETTTFEYDITKDKRYTLDKFQFHVPITMNFKAPKTTENINQKIRKSLYHNEAPNVIGIDRGERNLLYVVVINQNGEILKQRSLNEIIADYNGTKYRTDYHALLDVREKEMAKARKSWLKIESIKELKEGYLSLVIHEIIGLMIEYDAIVVLEDLNFGFKRSRQKFEKQVYQKFERMLIEKLNYMVDKKLEYNVPGGLLNAYQLTEKFDTFKNLGKQSGALFYVDAWNTSKIDPTTGFVNLFYLKYESINKAISFWKKFDSIHFNSDENYFEFSFNYSNFTNKAEGSREDWTLCSWGKRILNYRNKENNNEWCETSVDLTEQFIALFDEYNIDYCSGNLINKITEIDSKDFHEAIIRLFKLMTQMRNSISGTDVDYILSPVRNSNGKFYDSRDCIHGLPEDADANGAYNIARKGLLLIRKIKASEEDNLRKANLAISRKEWLQYAQETK